MRRSNAALILILLPALVPACTDPALGGKLFVCDDDGDCGDGWKCVYSAALGESVCRPEGYPVDAAGDSAFPDAASGDAGDAGPLPDTAAGDVGPPPDGAGDTVAPLDADAVDAGSEDTPGDTADDAADADGSDDGSDDADVASDVSASDTDAATPDTDAGNGDDACDPASCEPPIAPALQACLEHACVGGACTLAIKAGTCHIGGACFAEGDPGPDCTTCNPALNPQGWSEAPDATPCDDGDPCTGDGACAGGVCQEGAPVDCDDGDVCTTDSCGPGGCAHDPVAGKCDDGDLCTVDDLCQGGACQPGAPANCNDGNACTTDSCAAGAGCQYAAVTCTDGDACTVDGCAPATGCVFTPKACDDGNPCTTDLCDGGSCQFVPKTCSDGIPCTLDDCAPAKGGCVYTPDNGACGAGQPCLTWSCDLLAGCVSAPVSGEPCDDGNACTPTDLCQGGECDLQAFEPASPVSVKEDLNPSGPRMARDDGGTWVMAWSNGGTEGAPTPPGGGSPPAEIVIARSTSDGASFTVLGPLEEGPGNPHDSRDPAVATDGAGRWVIAFARSDMAPGSKRTTYAAVSSDDGLTWGAPVAVGKTSTFAAGEDSTPAVAYDPATGSFVVVWSSTVKIGASKGDMDLHVSRSTNGVSWSSPALLRPSMEADTEDDDLASGALVSDGHGRLVVAWAKEDDHGTWSEGDVMTAASTNGGVTWSSAVAVSPNAEQPQEAEHEEDPALATDGQGNWMLALSAAPASPAGTGAPSLRLWVSSNGGGTWEKAGAPGPSAPGAQLTAGQPAVASDGTGGWLLAWVTKDLEGALGQDWDALWSSSLDRGVSWSSPRAVSLDAYGDAGDDEAVRTLARATSGFAVTFKVGAAGEESARTLMAVWKEALPCTDGVVCTDDSCTGGNCKHAPLLAACDDGDACTTGDACAGGVCKGTASVTCEDSNPCTTDACEANGACTNTPTAGPCDDGDACTTGEACSGGACVGGVLPDCDDDDPCTSDGCDSDLGCVHALLAIACDDGDPCTEGDTCQAGGCAGTPMNCDDGNACTADTCSVDGGCEHADLGCDDGNPCTLDLCDGTTGCSYTMLSNMPCSGGAPCVPTMCLDGVCTAVPLVPSFAEVGLMNHWAMADGGAKDSQLAIATGITTMVAVLTTNLSTYGLDDDLDVVSVVSKDHGATWGPPLPLWSGETEDNGVDQLPHVAAGPEDSFMAVWASNASVVTGAGTDADVFSAIYDPAGATWGAPVPVADFMLSDDDTDTSPAVASTGLGTWVAIWSSNWDPVLPAAADRDLWVAHFADGAWSAPERLDGTAVDTWDDEGSARSLATDGLGTFVYAWPRVNVVTGDTTIVAVRSENWGVDWGAPVTITAASGSKVTGSAGGVNVATDGAGTWFAAWATGSADGNADLDVLFTRSTDNGVKWSTPAAVAPWMGSDVSADDSDPAVHFTPEGAWVVAWQSTYDGDGLGSDSDVLAIASRDGGTTWTAPFAVNAGATTDNADAQDEGAPVLAWSNGGGLLAAWTTTADGEQADPDDDYGLGLWTPTMMPCDDGDVTTSDICRYDDVATCHHRQVPVTCDDGDACTEDVVWTSDAGSLVCDYVTSPECVP